MYIKLYLSEPENKWNSYEDCYNDHLKKITRYHNEYGKDGFLSERTYESELTEIASKKARYSYSMKDALVINEVLINRISQEEEISRIENLTGFVQWINEDNVSVVPKTDV